MLNGAQPSHPHPAVCGSPSAQAPSKIGIYREPQVRPIQAEARQPPLPPLRADRPGMRSRERPKARTSAGLEIAAPRGADPPRTGCPRASTW
eukprot:1640056-Alexandrium_andersonii.AAC.1